jgi:hypothetical protein
MDEEAYGGRHLRNISQGIESYGLYDILDDIWTAKGRRHRKRLALYFISGTLLTWTAMAHFFGRW